MVIISKNCSAAWFKFLLNNIGRLDHLFYESVETNSDIKNVKLLNYGKLSKIGN